MCSWPFELWRAAERRGDADENDVWSWCLALGWLAKIDVQRQIYELNLLAMRWQQGISIDGADDNKGKGKDIDGGRREQGQWQRHRGREQGHGAESQSQEQGHRWGTRAI